MKESTLSSRYLNSVEEFLNFAFSFSSEEGTIRCPCVECNNVYFKTREEVQFDLVSMGIIQSYIHWYYHEEEEGEEHELFSEEFSVGDDMLGMLNEGIEMSHTKSRMFDQSNTCEEPNEKTKRFF